MTWVANVRAALSAVADPARAVDMRAYMKGVAPFFGVSAPVRRAAVRPLGKPTVDELPSVARALWAEPEREFAYVAVDWLEHATRKGPVSLIAVIEELVRSRQWWDTVDGLAASVGNLVPRYPELVATMEQWVHDEDFWIARVAILHQLGRGEQTDTERLFRFCLARAHEKEFFVAKAIGWALRDFAWHRPDLVAAFVREHREELRPLTIREATKNLAKAAERRREKA